ncbi:MAG: ribosome silencing factor [Ignavibacteria bacterium]|nr:ribosome silencing factor [Ignavibacteria bacterium]
MAKISKPRSEKGWAVLCARLAQEKQAQDLLVMDLSEIESSPAEYFVIVTVFSDAQMRAVCESIQVGLKSMGLGLPKVEGKGKSSWTILDYFDVVVHVMLPDAREFYKLERLWGDAKLYLITPAGAAKAVSSLPRMTAN